MHVACQNDGEHDDHDEDRGENGQSGGKRLLFRGRRLPGRFPVHAGHDKATVTEEASAASARPVGQQRDEAKDGGVGIVMRALCSSLGL